MLLMGMGRFLDWFGLQGLMRRPENSLQSANAGIESASVGAGDGNRTHDTQLGKLMFYH
jgi:hypothetical protein